jgi:hypothetical protein
MGGYVLVVTNRGEERRQARPRRYAPARLANSSLFNSTRASNQTSQGAPGEYQPVELHDRAPLAQRHARNRGHGVGAVAHGVRPRAWLPSPCQRSPTSCPS